MSLYKKIKVYYNLSVLKFLALFLVYEGDHMNKRMLVAALIAVTIFLTGTATLSAGLDDDPDFPAGGGSTYVPQGPPNCYLCHR
jgi:hypothetical protein